jgi:hypothetical protein
MKLENDNKYLLLRTTVIAVAIFWFTFIPNKILAQNLLFSFKTVNLYLVMLTFLVLFFLLKINSIFVVNRKLIFKNVFGITLKEIEIDYIKNRKIIYKNLPFGGTINLLSLFGKKYERFIEIKLSLQDGKQYNFNGQILSRKGLDILNSKIKN